VALATAGGLNEVIAGALGTIQNELFHLGSDLCILEEDKTKRPVPRIEERHVVALEKLMDRLSEELSPLENFILPGCTPGAAQLHVARTVCRRAERRVIALSRMERVGPHTVTYLNRLSDALFVMARHENKRRGAADVLWDSRA
jgi:cob(I)alamin adenosyltransferase